MCTNDEIHKINCATKNGCGKANVHRHEKCPKGDNRFLYQVEKKDLFFVTFAIGGTSLRRAPRPSVASPTASLSRTLSASASSISLICFLVRCFQASAGRYRRLPSDFLPDAVTYLLGPLVQLVRRRLFPGVRPTVRLVVVDGPLHLPRQCLHIPPSEQAFSLAFAHSLGSFLTTPELPFPGSRSFLLPSIVLGFQLAPLQGNSPPYQGAVEGSHAPPDLARQYDVHHPKYGRARRSFFQAQRKKK